MKKTNNRYRNNNSFNTFYSLNYKFDSNSIAGKISGTALDLIKRYNDLAKDAHSNNDYVTAEIFRQYAEHYRKIVTEINERKNAREQSEANDNTNSENNSTAAEENSATNSQTHAEPAQPEKCTTDASADKTECPTPEKSADTATPKRATRRSFHVIEINSSKNEEPASETASSTNVDVNSRPKRTYRRKKTAEE